VSDEDEQLTKKQREQRERTRRVMAGGGNITDAELKEYKSVDQWIAGALRILLVLDGENQMLFEASSHLEPETRTKFANTILYPNYGLEMLRSVQEIMEESLELDGAADAYEWVESPEDVNELKQFRTYLQNCVGKIDEIIEAAEVG